MTISRCRRRSSTRSSTCASTRARSARALTGAGFGGCVVALVARGTHEGIARAVSDRYRAETGREPRAFVVNAVDGAGLVAPE